MGTCHICGEAADNFVGGIYRLCDAHCAAWLAHKADQERSGHYDALSLYSWAQGQRGTRTQSAGQPAQGGTPMKITKPFRQLTIAQGAALREGRQPSHDGEYIMLYIDGDGEWFLSGNAGPLEIEGRGDIEAMIADAPDGTDTREAKNLLETIIEAEANPTTTGDPVTDIEALSLADRDIAKIMGWVA
jgi:hypothetical protein